MLRSPRFLALLALLSPLLLLPFGPPSASAAAPSLNTETFQEYDLDELVDQPCNPDGPQSIDFHFSGIAGGPYVGPYTHDGTVVLGAPNAAGLRQVLSYDAVFRIESGATVITGTMTQDPASRTAFVARCSYTPRQDGEVLILHEVDMTTLADYEATIQTGSETQHDVGKVFNGFTYQRAADGTNQGAGSNFYTETPTGPGPATTLTLSPLAAVNEVGTSHTVTATARDSAGNVPAPTQVVVTVRGSTTTSASCTTGTDGTCTVTYTGPQLPGADSISACADTNASSACEIGEPYAEATKAWILPATTVGKVTGGGQVPSTADPNHKVAFGFEAKNQSGSPSGTCQLVDQTPNANLLLKCVDVTALVVTGTHATLFGNATVNGTATTYRIDVDDLGEPGKGVDTFRIQTTSGYSLSGTLTAGNIQTH